MPSNILVDRFCTMLQKGVVTYVKWEYCTSRKQELIAEPEVIEASTLYAAMPAEAGLVEGLFAAQSHNMLVATSMSAGAVYLYEAPSGQLGEGKWTAVQIPGAKTYREL